MRSSGGQMQVPHKTSTAVPHHPQRVATPPSHLAAASDPRRPAAVVIARTRLLGLSSVVSPPAVVAAGAGAGGAGCVSACCGQARPGSPASTAAASHRPACLASMSAQGQRDGLVSTLPCCHSALLQCLCWAGGQRPTLWFAMLLP